MHLPKTILICGKRLKIRPMKEQSLIRKAKVVMKLDAAHGALYGFVDITKLIIYINSDYAPVHQAETLIHELLHVIHDVISNSDVENPFTKGSEEDYCSLVDGPWMQVLTENPELLTYLGWIGNAKKTI